MAAKAKALSSKLLFPATNATSSLTNPSHWSVVGDAGCDGGAKQRGQWSRVSCRGVSTMACWGSGRYQHLSHVPPLGLPGDHDCTAGLRGPWGGWREAGAEDDSTAHASCWGRIAAGGPPSPRLCSGHPHNEEPELKSWPWLPPSACCEVVRDGHISPVPPNYEFHTTLSF